MHNYGIVHTGTGDIDAAGAVFDNSRRSGPRPRPSGSVDVGIITVLGVEMYAVVQILRRHADYRVREDSSGVHLHAATVAGVRVAALQTVSPGQRSAGNAVHSLRKMVEPRVIALVGIAGSIDDEASIGDVVIAHEVFYYENRKETRDGAERRGQMLASAPLIGRKINHFMATSAPPHRMRDPIDGSAFTVLHGPIGSGEAVITYRDADQRKYLKYVNNKVLAVETEAGGVAQAVFESASDEGSISDWLTIRGISDNADETKDERPQLAAASHAALVTELLLPSLVVTTS
jgi:adenosylhomocysteine nucleosidase